MTFNAFYWRLYHVMAHAELTFAPDNQTNRQLMETYFVKVTIIDMVKSYEEALYQAKRNYIFLEMALEHNYKIVSAAKRTNIEKYTSEVYSEENNYEGTQGEGCVLTQEIDMTIRCSTHHLTALEGRVRLCVKGASIKYRHKL